MLSEKLADLAGRLRTEVPVDADEMADLLVKLDDAIGYELAMMEQHGVATSNTQCGYALCQLRPASGTFTGWMKVLGGFAPNSGPFGEYLLHDTKEEAAAVLAHMEPEISRNFRIFPVVLIAGIDPA